MENYLLFDGLSIGYKTKKGSKLSVFPNISAGLRPAELTVLLGRNGVGKSTLLRTLVGLQAPLDGDLSLMGKALSQYTAHEKASLISFVSTEKISIADFSVFNLVALGRYSHTNWIDKLTCKDISEVNEALRMADIVHIAKKNVNQLSDGELQRVMVARTLAQNTPIIILDEPTAFLDLPNKFELLLLLRQLAHKKNKTILLSTHDLNIAMRLADKLWLMSPEGLREGAPEDFALQKQLDGLLDRTQITFDYITGDINVNIQLSKYIELDCKDKNIYHWLQKALFRIGYCVAKSDAKIHVKVLVNNQFILQYIDSKQDFNCTSVYEMCQWLRKLNN